MENNKSSGAYNNLNSQINSLFANNRHSISIKSRYKYLDIERHFAGFLADRFHLQKLENVKSKHVIAYTESLKSAGKSPSTIKTSLAAVRYFHNLTGSKNQLITNDKLNIDPRAYKAIDRSWTKAEYLQALAVTKEERPAMYYIFKLGYLYGYRLEEVVKATPSHFLEALNSSGEVWCKGKNGQIRYIKIRTPEQEAAAREVLQYARELGKGNNDKIFCDNVKGSVQQCKRSVQNYITSNQHKWIDNNRIFLNDTAKIKSKNLVYHGLRYSYCNNLYADIYKETGNRDYSRKYCSEQLGHHRLRAVDVYLK